MGSSNFCHLSNSELRIINDNPFLCFPVLFPLDYPGKFDKHHRIFLCNLWLSLLLHLFGNKKKNSLRITMIRKTQFNIIPRIISSAGFAKPCETMTKFIFHFKCVDFNTVSFSITWMWSYHKMYFFLSVLMTILPLLYTNLIFDYWYSRAFCWFCWISYNLTNINAYIGT